MQRKGFKTKLFKVKGDINLNEKQNKDEQENIGDYEYNDGFLVKDSAENVKETEKALAWIRDMRKKRTQRIL